MKQLIAILALFSLPAWGGDEAVRVPGAGVELHARPYRPDGEGPFPAIVMLHGCSGMWTRAGKRLASYESWAEHFRKLGYAALMLDSFGPRRTRMAGGGRR